MSPIKQTNDKMTQIHYPQKRKIRDWLKKENKNVAFYAQSNSERDGQPLFAV
jgi:hypothetical protein